MKTPQWPITTRQVRLEHPFVFRIFRNPFLLHFAGEYSNVPAVVKPLAIVYYEQLLPGSQLLNKLQDLGYNPMPIMQISSLLPTVLRDRPFVLVMDLAARHEAVCEVIRKVKHQAETNHIPILAFAPQQNLKAQQAARAAGATLVAAEDAVLAQLPQLLDQVLQVE